MVTSFIVTLTDNIVHVGLGRRAAACQSKLCVAQPLEYATPTFGNTYECENLTNKILVVVITLLSFYG